MIGQVAVLRTEIGTLAQLHAEVSEQSAELVAQLGPAIEVNEPQGAPSDIAIVGMSVLLPGAQQPEIFWTNVLRGKASFKEIPPERWDWRLYYEPSRSARDKVYSKWGGFLDEVEFDPFHFGIPPNSLKSIETMQLLGLEATRRALIDAGYERGDFDRERTSVIFGASGGMSDLGQQYAARSEIPRMFGRVDGDVYDRLPEWTEESFPGLLFKRRCRARRESVRLRRLELHGRCSLRFVASRLGPRRTGTGIRTKQRGRRRGVGYAPIAVRLFLFQQDAGAVLRAEP